MARFRVFLKQFNDDGVYVADYTEITEDVISLGSISQAIDNVEYDVGTIRNAGFNLLLRNDKGLYSEPTNYKSIFRNKREESLIRITWDPRDYDLVCGFFKAGTEILGGQVTIFDGIIRDVTSTSDIDLQRANFLVLGKESLLDNMEVPFADISNGDSSADVLLTLLFQPPFNNIVNVDLMNVIGYTTAFTIDDKTPWENKTVSEVLKDYLLALNGVLYLKDNSVYVQNRTPAGSLAYTFYGQASENGQENILNVPSYKDGLNRIFNYWTWADTARISKDISSMGIYGVRKKEMKLDIITDNTKIDLILQNNRLEFSYPKPELEIHAPIWYTTLALNILDLVAIDYPTMLTPFDNNPLPRYGVNTYDSTARYPYEQDSLTIALDRRWKIIAKKIDTAKQIIVFKLREV